MELLKVSKLRLKIMESGMPQYVVGTFAAIHHSRMSEYCRMQRPIKNDHLMALCEVLRCDPEDIIGEADNSGFTPTLIR